MQFDIKNEKAQSGLEEFVGEFLNDREEELPQLQGHTQSHNFEELRQLAHRWKGFCQPYGFDGLGELSQKLEMSAKNKDDQECQNLATQIEEYLTLKRTAVASQK